MRSVVRRGVVGSTVDVVTMLAQTRLLGGMPSLARAIRTDGATVSAAVAASASRFGSGLALTDAQGSLSYQQLDAEVSRVASTLRAGNTIGLACGDTRAFVIGLAAASRAGADVVLLGPRLGAIDRAALIERHGIDVLVTDHTRLAHFRPVSGRNRGVSGQVGDGKHRRGRIIVLSSGTTGTPEPTERAPLRLSQAMTAASLIASSGLRPRHPVLLLAPLHHGHGLSLAVASLAIGAPLVLPGGLRMEATLELAASAQARVVSGVPAQLLRMMESLDEHPRQLRFASIVSGSARLPEALVARLSERFGPIVVDFFGSTETGTVTVARGNYLGTAGRPIAGATIRIVDASSDIVPRGTEGIVLAASPLSVSRAPSPTGDRGFLDAAGRLHLTGRANSVVVSGGENISAARVEDYLLAQPEIEDAHVFVVPDARLDSSLAARIVLRSPITAEQVLERMTHDLGKPRCPRALEIVDTIPRTATGKARV